MQKLNITEILENAKTLIEQDKQISPAIKAMFELLITVIILLTGKLSLTSHNSSKPPSKFKTAEGLTKLIAIFCILSWRIFWMTMLNRNCPGAPAKLALTEMEINLLDQLVKEKKDSSKKLSYYLTKIAKLGGYLARASDPPPGNLVMWRDFNRLTDIAFGFYLAKNCG